MHNIVFIYSQDCKDCARMKKIIHDGIENHPQKEYIRLREFDYDNDPDNAINAAIEYKIHDLPGCNINNVIICGKSFSEEKLKKTIQEIK